MIDQPADAVETAVDQRIRLDMRDVRRAAGLPQEAIADLFGWGRDAVSKMESGQRRIRLSDYLEIIRFCQHAVPGHPALPLVYAMLKGTASTGGEQITPAS